jgi:outer membrane usher protein
MRAPKPRPAHRRGIGSRTALAAFAASVGLLLAPPARADPDQGAGRALQLEVFLNGETRNLLASFIELPEHGLAATRKELKDLGIKPPGEGGDEDLVPLAAMPEVSYGYDEPRQRVDIVLPNERRMPHVIDARGAAKALDPAQAGYGAVLNYTLFGSSVTQVEDKLFAFTGASAQLDGRVFTPLGYLQQTGIVGTTLNRDVSVLRLDTTFVYSDPDTAVTYRAGDAISRGPAWARPIRFGGLQIERNFALRSDLVTAPLPAISGSAAVPSTVEVFVDNLRTFSHQVPAGPYNVTNLPILSSSGTARVVLRDASGREVETSLPFFASPQLLREGLVDFSVQAGYPRQSYAVEADLYSDKPFASVGVRYGLLDSLTVETYGEGGADLFNGGAGLVTNAGAFGVFSVAGRASQHNGETGFQAYASAETRILGFTIGASTQRSFGAFEDIASLTAGPGYLGGAADPFTRYKRSDPTFVDPVIDRQEPSSTAGPRSLFDRRAASRVTGEPWGELHQP